MINLSKQFLLSVFILFLASNVKATNYYISNTGDDSNDGLTLENAYLTIQHAVDIVDMGDTVFVEDGTYEGFDIRDKSGTADNPIVFKAMNDNALLNIKGPLRNDIINVEEANYIVIDGFITNNALLNGNGIRVVVSNNCIVRNNSCDNNAERGIFTAFTDDVLIEHNLCTNSIDEHGIYVSNSSDRPIIRYNECYGNNGIGIHMNGDLSAGGDGIISDAMVYGNVLHDNNHAAGINMDGLQNPTIFNNLIYNNHFAQGIALFQQDGAIVTNGAKIFNNTIIVPDDGRWGILVKDGANINTEIYNNIIINNHAWRGCIALESTTDFTSNYNIVNDKLSDDGDGTTITFSEWQALGFDIDSELADPMTDVFIDPSLNDYHLLEDCQAIDAGTSLVSPIVSVDYDGNTRPIGAGYDIGAYEFIGDLTANNYLTNPIKLFPNPTTDLLNISVVNKQNYLPIVLDVLGRDVTNQIQYNYTEKGVSLRVTQLEVGIYFLSINGNSYPFYKI